jgi:hypothetical protein
VGNSALMNLSYMLKKALLLLLYGSVVLTLLYLPYSRTSHTHEENRLIDNLVPSDVNNGFDPIFGFCLYAPALLVLEGLFLKLPLRGWQLALMIAQLIGVLWTYPFVALVPLEINFFGIPSGNIPISRNILLIEAWAFFSVIISILILIPGTSRLKWMRWQFSKD